MRNRIIILFACALTLSAQLPSGNTQVANAAENRDTAGIRRLLAQHVNPNAGQPDGTTALHWAAHWNDADAVKLLLQSGADAKAVNRFGATPLSEAAGVGSTAIVNALLAAGVDARTLTTKDGETVLMTAARGGYLDIVKTLASHGADVNAQEHYKSQTALMWAAAEGHSDVVKFLLDHGADWKVQSSMRESKIPKLSAASSVTPMSRGGLTALHFSAREGDVISAEFMLDAGADMNIADGDGTSPLTVAILNKQYTFAKFLLDRGANPNVADVRGEAALYAAIDMRNEDYSALPLRKREDAVSTMEIMQALVKHGADLNAALTKNLPGKSGMDAGDTSLDKGTNASHASGPRG